MTSALVSRLLETDHKSDHCDVVFHNGKALRDVGHSSVVLQENDIFSGELDNKDQINHITKER